ncbi:hypothetical protein HCC61_03390 [Streptomyces sp. HNM0575]|uniref:hypothetical protein n=1 Tax=Streptomyces sp. HNM0575 TaxID=2716338 RepID=UPI00145E0393|nr:hypothetical protein [Streptomyces sp. HNM0575]NLU71739.1 hypothetical protein [Streptomyces sp. HNM0575]
MFSRSQVTQNKIVARRMRRFFRDLPPGLDPSAVAKAYGRHLWDSGADSLADEKKLSRSRFYVGLSVESTGLSEFTKRAALISDTLLLSHDHRSAFHEIESYAKHGIPFDSASAMSESLTDPFSLRYGMRCPSLDVLGRWILDSEPLLKAGLAWYLPSYSTIKKGGPKTPQPVEAIDYLIRDGRVIDASGGEPVKDRLVRPVCRMDLPFIDGVDLADFSRITVDEFSSYSAFRDFLRLSFLNIDDALNDVQSDRELMKIGLEIKDQVRSVRSEMKRVKGQRAVAAGGAVVASVSAALVAVYGPALEWVAGVIGGATPGLWGLLQARGENSTRPLREDKWHYVWTLSKESNTDVF